MIDFVKECGFGETDLDLFGKYIHMYGHPHAMSAEAYLQEWFSEKSKYLLPIFGNKSIISEKVSYTTPRTLLLNEVHDKIVNNSDAQEMRRSILKIAELALFDKPREDIYYGAFGSMSAEERSKYTKANNLYGTIDYCIRDSEGLSENAIQETGWFEGKSSISLKPGPYNNLTHVFSIRVGQKPFRLINNIIREWYGIAAKIDPDTWTLEKKKELLATVEKFRILHSQILNVATLKGTLVLSIHPMDYVTASDNNSNWHSCMTWTRDKEPGEYRVGTLEMMNSPSVVVAYLEGDTPYFPCGGDYPAWHNKKWREFFIVDKNFISSVKGYPYHADELESLVLKKLSKMCEAYGWPAYHETIHETEDEFISINDVRFPLYTDIMYNDTTYNGVRYITSMDVDQDLLASFHLRGFYYSGVAYCLVCGRTLSGDEIAEGEENRPYCESCSNEAHCAECGGHLMFVPGCYTEVDGKFYCEDCMTECDICHTPIRNIDENKINIVTTCREDSEIFHRYVRHMCPQCQDKYAQHLTEVDITETQLRDQLLYSWMPNRFRTTLPSMPQAIMDAFNQAYRHDKFCGEPCDLTAYAT